MATSGAPPTALLAQQLKAFASTLRRRLREQADDGDLTPSQITVLLRLERDGAATTSSLARAEGIRPQSMSAIVAALDGAGLVAGTADPADGRQTLLALTPYCRDWLAHARAARQDWLTRTVDERLTAEERKQLTAIIPLLQRLIAE